MDRVSPDLQTTESCSILFVTQEVKRVERTAIGDGTEYVTEELYAGTALAAKPSTQISRQDEKLLSPPGFVPQAVALF